MPFTDSALSAIVDAAVAAGTPGTWLSLHTADPGATGASEVSGGSPAYARKSTTWPAASAGDTTGTAVTFDVPASTTVTHFGVWSAVTGGTFHGGGSLSASETFTGQGTYELTATVDFD